MAWNIAVLLLGGAVAGLLLVRHLAKGWSLGGSVEYWASVDPLSD